MELPSFIPTVFPYTEERIIVARFASVGGIRVTPCLADTVLLVVKEKFGAPVLEIQLLPSMTSAAPLIFIAR